MGFIGYLKKILKSNNNIKQPDLDRFPIHNKIKKVEYTNKTKSLSKSEYTIQEKYVSPGILLRCVHDFFDALKSEENSACLFSDFYKKYKGGERVIQEIIKCLSDDFFIKKDTFEKIVEGKYELDGSYSDLSLFFFNLLVYGHPLLIGYSKSECDFLDEYSDYLVEFVYDKIEHRTTLSTHVVASFYLILRVVFTD